MKFSCEKAPLQAAISITSRAVSPKGLVPALEGVLLEAGSDLRFTGYNLGTGIRTIAPTGIREEGTLMLDVHLLDEIVRKLPDDTVTFQSENYMVNIKCGTNKFNILGTDLEEFPELPTMEYQDSLISPQPRLEAMISQTLFAVNGNKSRPIHTSSLFEVNNEGLTTVLADGYRLTLRHEPIDKKEGAKTFSLIVPGAALSGVEKICSDVDEPASITRGAHHVMSRVGDIMLVFHCLKGEFLAYCQATSRNNTTHVEGDAHVLLSSVDRMSLTISDRPKGPLRCVFDSNLLGISTKTAIGDTYDECPLSGGGGRLEIGFSNKYLMDALKAAPADKVRLELTTGVSPCVTLPTEGRENSLYMVPSTRPKAGE